MATVCGTSLALMDAGVPLARPIAGIAMGLIKEKEPLVDESLFHSAIPRTWLFADGSAFIHHIRLVRKARNAALPETLLTVPLMYQAESGRFLSPTDEIPQIDIKHGTDFETIPEAGGTQQILKFDKTYHVSSQERSRFFNRVTKNSIIEIWINSEDNAVDVTEPEHPDFLLKLYILLPTLGLFLFFFVAAPIFLERVVVKKRRRLKPTNGF